MRQLMQVALIPALLGLGACKDLTVPDYNAQSLSSLQAGATQAAIGTAAIGLLATSRDFNTSFLQSYVVSSGEFGREGMELDPSNGQHPLDRLQSPLGVGEPGYAGWQTAYKLIRQSNVLIHALDSTSTITDPQKESVRGFAQTIKALSFMRLNNSFDQSGQPIATDIATTAAPAAIMNGAGVRTYIAALLDSAKTHLLAGGSAFPFTPIPGFTGFDTPANFLKVNRALRARLAVYSADWAGALQSLTESFVDSTAALTLGAYDIYSANSGDKTNPLYDPTCRQLFSMTVNRTEAQKQADGVTLDQRYLNKILDITPKVSDAIPVSACFKIYSSSASPIPIVKNEELLLLRAEALLQTGDRVNALKYVNFVRANSGKLPPVADPGATGGTPVPDQLLDEILYNRRYSLIWEQGARWADARRYGFLATLPTVLPKHVIYPYLPLPSDECVPRSPQPLGCTAPTPIPGVPTTN